jgi:hypothetical protein
MKLRTKNLICFSFGAVVGMLTAQTVRYLLPVHSWCTVSVCGFDLVPLFAGAIGALAGALWAWYSFE